MQCRYFPKRVNTRAYDTRAIFSLKGENEGVGHNARSVLS